MIRVLTGARHSVIRARIWCVLASGRSLRVAGEASNRVGLHRLVRATAYEVVMVEIAGARDFRLDPDWATPTYATPFCEARC